jgi:hypothetical protein
MPAPSNILKQCSSCGVDIASQKRWKDGAGHYYCEACWIKKSGALPARASVPANANQADVPAASSGQSSGTTVMKCKITKQLIQYNCPYCSSPLESSFDEAGTKDSCPRCGNNFVVPGQREIAELRRQQQLQQKRVAEVAAERAATKKKAKEERLKQAAEKKRAEQLAMANAVKPPDPNNSVTSSRPCPFCDGEIQAIAKKCKHCGEWLDRQPVTPALDYRGPNSVHRSTMLAPARSYLNSAILTLILYVIGFGIVGLIANVVYLSSAKRVEQETGEKPEGKGCLVALLWVFVWIPLIIGVVVLMVFLVADMRH